MYRPTTNPRDRVASIAIVAAIHAGLLLAFLNLSGTVRIAGQQPDLAIFDVTDPPPPSIEDVPQPDQARPKKEEGAASPKNIESKATEVVAPKPRISLPVPVPMPVTETPNSGNEPTQGASTVAGPGTGAGGTGNGTGSGGAGTGSGGGGTGGQASGPSVLRKLSNADYPDSVIRAWPRGGRVFVRLRIQPDGRASDCRVDRSSGVAAIDQWTCALVVERARFKPATDDRGRPVASWYGYIQADTGGFQRR